MLVIPTIREPRALQYLRALRVSAVSPDWEMKKHTSSLKKEMVKGKMKKEIQIAYIFHQYSQDLKQTFYLKIGVFLSRKSDAKSSITGSSVNSSSNALDAMAE